MLYEFSFEKDRRFLISPLQLQKEMISRDVGYNASLHYFEIIVRYSIYIQVIGIVERKYRTFVRIIIKLRILINVRKLKFKIL